MSMTPEAKVKKHIKEVLKQMGAYVVMPVGSGYGNAGVPDFVVCMSGRFIGIEAKAGKGTTTALQKEHLAAITRAGGVAVVVNESNIDQLEEFICSQAKR